MIYRVEDDDDEIGLGNNLSAEIKTDDDDDDQGEKGKEHYRVGQAIVLEDYSAWNFCCFHSKNRKFILPTDLHHHQHFDLEHKDNRH